MTRDITHKMLDVNDIRMHVAEQGDGPAVLFCHGFPESWNSWRHQMAALSESGYRAIAPHLRGHGQTTQPVAIDQYTLLHLLGDMVCFLDAREIDTAVIVGSDWGAIVAWHAALLRPDRFRGVVALAVPMMGQPLFRRARSFLKPKKPCSTRSTFRLRDWLRRSLNATRALLFANCSSRLGRGGSQAAR